MKIPEIQTRNKIRDAKICNMFLNLEEKSKIAEKFGITIRTVDRILYKNASVLKKALELTKDQEKVNRIMFLRKQMRLSKKYDIDLEFSPLTLNDELKKELEGNSPIGMGGETRIIIIRDGNKTETLSRQVPLQQGEVSSDGKLVGNGEVNVRNTAGNDILRADTK